MNVLYIYYTDIILVADMNCDTIYDCCDFFTFMMRDFKMVLLEMRITIKKIASKK